nr:amidohydrolase family protein [Veillonella denticariosi]
MPGFIDSHLHLESTLVNPKELVFEASQVGTLGFIVDPHEAGNVAGIAGIEYMINETATAQGGCICYGAILCTCCTRRG